MQQTKRRLNLNFCENHSSSIKLEKDRGKMKGEKVIISSREKSHDSHIKDRHNECCVCVSLCGSI